MKGLTLPEKNATISTFKATELGNKNCIKLYLNWSFQKNRMSKLHKFSLCRVHANCLCLLCDTHLLKQEQQNTVSKCYFKWVIKQNTIIYYYDSFYKECSYYPCHLKRLDIVKALLQVRLNLQTNKITMFHYGWSC